MLNILVGIVSIIILLVVISGSYRFQDLVLGLYILVAVGVIGGGSYSFYSSAQSVAALLFFVGTLTIFIIFGLKWFSSSNAIFSKTPVTWPPTLNTCPDYLVHYKRKMKDGTVENTCIDVIGVSKNSTLKVFKKPGDDDGYYFSLKTAASESELRKKELCDRAIKAGLTWEGITNGESCTISSDLTLQTK